MDVSYFLILGPGHGLVLISMFLIQTLGLTVPLVLNDLGLFSSCHCGPSTPPSIAISSCEVGDTASYQHFVRLTAGLPAKVTLYDLVLGLLSSPFTVYFLDAYRR